MEIGEFANCLRSGTRPLHTEKEGIDVLCLILAAYEGARNGTIAPVFRVSDAGWLSDCNEPSRRRYGFAETLSDSSTECFDNVVRQPAPEMADQTGASLPRLATPHQRCR